MQDNFVQMTCTCIPEFLEGYRFNEIIGEYFAVCAYTPRDITGFIFGMLNILLWLFAQVPQLITNYRNKTAESLSCVFLTSWLIGDVTNLMGCILTGQTQIQLYTSIYFIIMDMFILGQWIYYKRVNAKKKAEAAKTANDDPEITHLDVVVAESKLDKGINNSQKSKRMYAVFFALSLTMAKLATNVAPETYSNLVDTLTSPSSVAQLQAVGAIPASIVHDGIATLSNTLGLSAAESMQTSLQSPAINTAGAFATTVSETPKECDFTAEVSHGAYVFGVVSSWICAVLYFYARIPQIMLNYRRKSCEGLSLGLFFSSTMANFFYAISLLLPSTAVLSGPSFWQTTFAYLGGSLCVNALSMVILGQMWYYRHNKSPVDPDNVQHERESLRENEDIMLAEKDDVPKLGFTSSHYADESEPAQVPARAHYTAPVLVRGVEEIKTEDSKAREAHLHEKKRHYSDSYSAKSVPQHEAAAVASLAVMGEDEESE